MALRAVDPATGKVIPDSKLDPKHRADLAKRNGEAADQSKTLKRKATGRGKANK